MWRSGWNVSRTGDLTGRRPGAQGRVRRSNRLMKIRFRDRQEAGELLAAKLMKYANQPGLLVLALPRGGVAVGYEVARRLHAPLDVFLVRKLGVPGREELAMGAIASGQTRVLNGQVLEMLAVPDTAIEAAVAREQLELERRERVYRGDRIPLEIPGRTIIVVDDGIATGSTMRAAIAALRQHEPQRIVVAAPAAALAAVRGIRDDVDEVVTVMTPANFYCVGEWYQDFPQITDDEVCACLRCRERELFCA